MDMEQIRKLFVESLDQKLSEKERDLAVSLMDKAFASNEKEITEVKAKLESTQAELTTAKITLAALTTERDELVTSTTKVKNELEAANLAKDEVSKTLADEVSLKEATKEELSTVKETLVSTEASLDTATAEKSVLQESLDAINLEKISVERLAKLEAAGLQRSGDALELQKQKVVVMTNEVFDAYVEELAEIKEAAQKTQSRPETETAGLVNPELNLTGEKSFAERVAIVSKLAADSKE